MSKVMIDEKEMDQVVGGFMYFNYSTKVLTYTHEETQNVTNFNILDFENAWKMSNSLHAQNHHEDVIIARMLEAGYIEK